MSLPDALLRQVERVLLTAFECGVIAGSHAHLARVQRRRTSDGAEIIDITGLLRQPSTRDEEP